MNESATGEILLVEDNPQDLELTLRALRKVSFAYRIHTVADGQTALDFIFCDGAHAHRRNGKPLKMILLDLNLPKIDGLEVLRQIKNDPSTRSIPVVVLTSSKEQIDEVESYKAGVNSYIIKPLTFENFINAVQQLGLHLPM
jgi:CheY-like chemotaxis protein